MPPRAADKKPASKGPATASRAPENKDAGKTAVSGEGSAPRHARLAPISMRVPGAEHGISRVGMICATTDHWSLVFRYLGILFLSFQTVPLPYLRKPFSAQKKLFRHGNGKPNCVHPGVIKCQLAPMGAN